jgi:outer membrane murein-binding lipoprotein Lpp
MHLYKALALFIMIVPLFLSGCVSDAKYKEVSASLAESTEKITKLEADLSASVKGQQESENRARNLETELTELKNGPAMLILDIRKQNENKNHDQVLKLSTELHSRFPGVPEDLEAQQMVKEIQNLRAEASRKAEEEKARVLAEQAKSAEEKAKSIVRVSKVYPGKPNSAGGVDVYISWRNNSDKVIKYIVFAVEPYNAVNDKVGSEIGNFSMFRGKSTGPFNKGEGSSGNTYWENAWYNNTIKSVQLKGVEIEYMDGSTIDLKGDDLKYIQY